MVFFTRMGWLVLAIWLGALIGASNIPPEKLTEWGIGLSKVSFMFLSAAAISAPLLFIVGTLLNREKHPRTIKRFGKDKVVNWGTHTFNFLPVEYWALIIPVATVIAYAILALV